LTFRACTGAAFGIDYGLMLDYSPFNVGLSRRLRRKGEIRQKLYDAAIALFRRQGYESTTIQDICDMADTAKQTFFNYFPSKEHVLADYHGGLVQNIFEQISQVSSSSHTKAVISAMRIFAGGAEKSVSLNRAILRHVFSNVVLENVDQKNEEKIFSWFHTRLRQAIQSAELDPGLNSRLLTAVTMSVLSSTVQEWIVSPRGFDLEEELVSRTRFLLRLAGKRKKP